MITFKKLMVGGLILVLFSGLIFLYGNSREDTGRLKEKTIAQDAQILWRKNFDRDRAAGALRVQKAEVNLREARKQTDALKADIARRDKDAADWLAVRMPVPLSDLVWTLDAGPVSIVPGGTEPTARFDPTKASYRTSHE